MMKANVIKAKDKYAQSCGCLDWYDHISGMSARDVEIEMEYVCEQVASEMLEMLIKCEKVISELGIATDDIKQLIKEATEL